MPANIIDLREHPAILGVASANDVVGRTILDWSPYCGSYGNGGPGFVGFRLDASDRRPVEWLLLTIFRASAWLTVSDCWLTAHPDQYQQRRPLIGYGEESWDDFTELVLRKRIEQFVVMQHCCLMRVQGTMIGIPPDPSTRPAFAQTGQPRRLAPSEDLRHAWVLADRAAVMI